MDSTTPILEQASHWWHLLHSEDVSAADRRAFGEWVARSPERTEAYLKTVQLVGALRSPELHWPNTSTENLIREAKASPEDVVSFTPAARAPAPAHREPRRYFQRRFALGAAAMLLGGIGLALFMIQAPQEYKTAIGEQRSLLLADGSRITLNTASRIEVELHANRRLVHLVEGEALFEVAHDASRPFKVRVRGAELSDVGTQFDVDMRPNGTTVTIVEGRVAIDSYAGEGKPNKVEILAANDRVVISPSGPGPTQHGIDAATALAWTRRQLIFEHRSLGEVADEFNRYNRDRIDIEGEELQRQEVTGVFEAKDPGSFLAFLSGIPGVEIREGRAGSHVVAIRKAATKQGM